MLLTISTTHRPATDLGYLLHKHPERTQTFQLSFGEAHVFYPEATEEQCTAALLLDVDPVGLVRGKKSFSLSQYVNDRPYVASSFMSVAIARVLGSALSGKSRDRADLADAPLPLTATVSALPARGGEEVLRRLFEPLGYSVAVETTPFDSHFEDWGPSRYVRLTLEGTVRLKDMLRHLYVLIPVLDDAKHYWVSEDEIDKLLEKGEGWLPAHPEKELIARRYLRHRRALTRDAMRRLTTEDESAAEDEREAAVEKRISLHELRLGAVVAALRGSGAKSVLDLGCGEGRLLRSLLKERSFERVVGLDVSARTLGRARDRLKVDRLPDRVKERLTLRQGSLVYRDERLSGFDAAALVEVIEHLDPSRLAAFERVLFEFATPRTVVVTTPNREYNTLFETLPAGQFRHRDHRFEWTRSEFADWANSVAERFDYSVRFLPIGPEDEQLGPPSQMAVFDRMHESEGAI